MYGIFHGYNKCPIEFAPVFRCPGSGYILSIEPVIHRLYSSKETKVGIIEKERIRINGYILEME